MCSPSSAQIYRTLPFRATPSRPAQGATQVSIQWVPRVRRPGHEADHSHPSSAEVKNAWSYTAAPQYVFMVWCLVKHRDNFTTFIRYLLKDFGQETLIRETTTPVFSNICVPVYFPLEKLQHFLSENKCTLLYSTSSPRNKYDVTFLSPYLCARIAKGIRLNKEDHRCV